MLVIDMKFQVLTSDIDIVLIYYRPNIHTCIHIFQPTKSSAVVSAFNAITAATFLVYKSYKTNLTQNLYRIKSEAFS